MSSSAPKPLVHRKNPTVLLMAFISKDLMMGGERGLQEVWKQRQLLCWVCVWGFLEHRVRSAPLLKLRVLVEFLSHPKLCWE